MGNKWKTLAASCALVLLGLVVGNPALVSTGVATAIEASSSRCEVCE